MPGGRLTQEDRRRIAVWLVEGEGYAEIARRLGRPTSTISREVARNGGPGFYLADRAHQATSKRARRRKPTPPTQPPSNGQPPPNGQPPAYGQPSAYGQSGASGQPPAFGPSSAHGQSGASGRPPTSGQPGAYGQPSTSGQSRADGRPADGQRSAVGQLAADGQPTELMRGFVEEFAARLAGTGLPRMAARVFTCLLTSESGTLTAAELVRRLRVSPASVSKAIGYLEGMVLVSRRPDPGGRRELYFIDDATWLRAWRADTRAHAAVAEAAERGIGIFGADTPAGTRLRQMEQFFSWVSEGMHDSSLSDIIVADALTVVAALVYTAQPLTADELIRALNLPPDRVTGALDALEHRSILAEPLALHRSKTGAYTLTARTDRLTSTQRHALHALTSTP